ncbi:MAG: DUF3842 family protein [Oscillospiraceae bacterium]|nr:DUF3842 family protein [Oscillospiraceae bacterium]
MRVLVIDGMGGGVGKAVIERLRAAGMPCDLHAVGTNAAATGAMLKAGADRAATGENAAVYACARADCIVGAVGIALADAMLGEITPRMAQAVAQSPAPKVLIPTAQCNALIVGLTEKPLAQYIDELPGLLQKLAARL